MLRSIKQIHTTRPIFNRSNRQLFNGRALFTTQNSNLATKNTTLTHNHTPSFKAPVPPKRTSSMSTFGPNSSGLTHPISEPRLTETESKICSVLDEVAKGYEAREGKKVQLRIAGGWVRDKVRKKRMSCT